MGMVSFRAEPDAIKLFDQAAEECDVSRSVWLREAAMAALEDPGAVLPHSRRALAVQARQLGASENLDACVHPLTARRDLPFSVICSICGQVVRTR